MYSDTDSFIYNIRTDNVYEDMKQNIDLFDTSDYSVNNVYGIPLVNKKVLGKMKDECQGEIMTEFIGLRSKMYTFIVNSKTVKKCKGVKKSTIDHKIEFSDYKNCLFNETQMLTSMNLIRSKKHKIYTVKANKLSLSPLDQKRYVLEDKINTLPFGHFSIKSE